MTRLNKIAIFLVVLILSYTVSIFAYGISARWTNGTQEFYEKSTGETVAVMAPDQFFDLYQPGTTVRGVTDTYALQATNSGLAKYNADGLVLTTGASDNNDVQAALSAKWQPSLWATMEFEVAGSDASGTAWCIGFSDAQAESAGNIAVTKNGTTTTTNATDGAFFFTDSEMTTDTINSITVKDGTDGTETTGAAWAADTLRTYRIEMHDDGKVKFYAANSLLATNAAASMTGADKLIPYIGVKTNGTVASKITLTYLKVWQRR